MKGKLTLYLILKNSLIVQIDKVRNYYPTSLSFISSLSFSKNHEKAAAAVMAARECDGGGSLAVAAVAATAATAAATAV